MTQAGLLSVFGQNLFAALADPGTVLLEACQHGRIAVIHHSPAMTCDVARAGIMSPLRRSRGSQNDERNKRNE
jgi:hypothetical protein